MGRLAAKGDLHAATAQARWWAERFPDRYYLEVTRTGRTGEDQWVAHALTLAQAVELPVVATNDVCFLERDDFEAHETRVCIQEGRTLNDPRRERRFSDQQYLKDAKDMAELFSDLPEALANTVEIARRCSVRVSSASIICRAIPRPPVPPSRPC
ncbi:MAG: hypothetical protein HC809_06210 [Gammaproteobacteria bacterium]|nr:hypothetical protein [Gammaproteobacteria bacterium]